MCLVLIPILLNFNSNYIRWQIQDFPVKGCGPIKEGHGPPTRALFGENVCKNERIGPHRGV